MACLAFILSSSFCHGYSCLGKEWNLSWKEIISLVNIFFKSVGSVLAKWWIVYNHQVLLSLLEFHKINEQLIRIEF